MARQVEFASGIHVTGDSNVEGNVTVDGELFDNSGTGIRSVTQKLNQLDTQIIEVYESFTGFPDNSTVFTLSYQVDTSFPVLVFVNGIKQLPSDFTVSGNTLTWVSTDFNLEGTDLVEIIYHRI